MLSKRFIYRLKHEYCVDDYTQIEGFWEAYNDDLPSIKHCVHHKYGIVLNKTKEQLIYMGLYKHRYARELQIMLRSDHFKLHNTGKRHPMYGKNCEDFMTEEAIKERRKKISKSNTGEKNGMYGNTRYKGENNPMYGKPSAIKDKHRVYDNKELNIFHYE